MHVEVEGDARHQDIRNLIGMNHRPRFHQPVLSRIASSSRFDRHLRGIAWCHSGEVGPMEAKEELTPNRSTVFCRLLHSSRVILPLASVGWKHVAGTQFSSTSLGFCRLARSRSPRRARDLATGREATQVPFGLVKLLRLQHLDDLLVDRCGCAPADSLSPPVGPVGVRWSNISKYLTVTPGLRVYRFVLPHSRGNGLVVQLGRKVSLNCAFSPHLHFRH
mmetsp:Transcript_39512/g.66362  ORF Transcript_39512/g.66362 Transcript_39512/m.66362 type:complete len:220 (+) Transcript_39512:332-991(+)